ncbi:unnamed protein product, partial [Rotaria sp. Silwood1]
CSTILPYVETFNSNNERVDGDYKYSIEIPDICYDTDDFANINERIYVNYQPPIDDNVEDRTSIDQNEEDPTLINRNIEDLTSTDRNVEDSTSIDLNIEDPESSGHNIIELTLIDRNRQESENIEQKLSRIPILIDQDITSHRIYPAGFPVSVTRQIALLPAALMYLSK